MAIISVILMLLSFLEGTELSCHIFLRVPVSSIIILVLKILMLVTADFLGEFAVMTVVGFCVLANLFDVNWHIPKI